LIGPIPLLILVEEGIYCADQAENGNGELSYVTQHAAISGAQQCAIKVCHSQRFPSVFERNNLDRRY
jgi:hypothetical protein